MENRWPKANAVVRFVFLSFCQRWWHHSRSCCWWRRCAMINVHRALEIRVHSAFNNIIIIIMESCTSGWLCAVPESVCAVVHLCHNRDAGLVPKIVWELRRTSKVQTTGECSLKGRHHPSLAQNTELHARSSNVPLTSMKKTILRRKCGSEGDENGV